MLKNLLLLSGFSAFVVAVIIGLNIYHDNSTTSLPLSTQTHVTAISPDFDKKSIDNLKKRVPIETSLTEKSNIVSEDSKTTSSEITPTPTQSATVVASQSATPVIPINPGILP